MWLALQLQVVFTGEFLSQLMKLEEDMRTQVCLFVQFGGLHKNAECLLHLSRSEQMSLERTSGEIRKLGSLFTIVDACGAACCRLSPSSRGWQMDKGLLTFPQVHPPT